MERDLSEMMSGEEEVRYKIGCGSRGNGGIGSHTLKGVLKNGGEIGEFGNQMKRDFSESECFVCIWCLGPR